MHAFAVDFVGATMGLESLPFAAGMSLCLGTFETCLLHLRASAFRGILEVPLQGRQDRI